MTRRSITCCLDPSCELRCPGKQLAQEYHHQPTPADAKVARWMRWYGFLLIVLVAVGAALAQTFA